MDAEIWAGFQARFSIQLGELSLEIDLDTAARNLAIVGPSGSGKSTLLRVLAGLESSAHGRLLVGGATWMDSDRGLFAPPWARNVGWVPQNDLLLPHLSVRENLAYTGAATEPTGEVAELLEIRPLMDRRPHRLSGGERQRVALGRALLAAPDVLLLDEPFAALDRALRIEVAQRVREWTEARKLPLVLVSHDEEDTSVLADERWVVEGRKIRKE